MIMWPQMIDKIFWQFAMKVISEMLNSLQIEQKGITLESILHGSNMEDIPVNHLTHSHHNLRARR